MISMCWVLHQHFKLYFEGPFISMFPSLEGKLEAKLRDYGTPKHIQIKFVRDILGYPTQLEDGIVDANSTAEYDAMVQSLQIIWDDRRHTIILSNFTSGF